MLITLSGAGTEWIANDDVDWTAFADRESMDPPMQADAEIRQFPTGNWSLLKGGSWSEHFAGVVHRSPHNVGERLLLTLDPIFCHLRRRGIRPLSALQTKHICSRHHLRHRPGLSRPGVTGLATRRTPWTTCGTRLSTSVCGDVRTTAQSQMNCRYLTPGLFPTNATLRQQSLSTRMSSKS